MEELTLITPSVLFSAVSLILLAYTNRFLAYAQLVRTLKDRYEQDRSAVTQAQIENLRKRLNLSRLMQVFGTVSLFLCVVTMFVIYIGLSLTAIWIFGLALLALIVSLGLSIWEIIISSRALELYLGNMKQ
ncbi:MAG: DUF2721 domain-containing protein [Paludibacteraceae bacterium]|jgi:hypothetical protein|nr:DUF2721 domain-containing protein [Paludibacteraceae bacterium]